MRSDQAMMLPRRRLLALAGAVAASSLTRRVALAQGYPTRPVRIIVATAAGGSTDIAARVIASWLTDRLGYSFVVENRPGGANNIGTEAALRAPPDGYTLLMANSVNTINTTFYDKLPFNFITDIAPVGGVMRSLVVMQVHPSVPARTVAEFIAHAKANPGQVSMGSGGMGATGHVAGELFQMMAGVKLIHVPYRGEAPALVDLLAGQVHVVFTTLSSSIEYLRAGKLRPLAVSTPTRSPALPDVPPMSDAVPGYEASSWSGLCAPRGTPPEIVAKLNQAINAGLADPGIQKHFVDIGAGTFPGSPADFGAFLAADAEKWAKVIRFSGAKPN
jgi:tripartite-type tricarboxylate transporter receptor subunit TctC